MQIKSGKFFRKYATDHNTGKMCGGYDSADCVPFVLDTDKIELHSTDKQRIMLPYVGHLPVEFEGAENPRISMFVRPGDVRIVLFANRDGKKLHASIEATPKEINDIMFRFFFKDKGNNACHTRFDNGLDRYWLGYYQAEYMMWRQITLEGYAGSIASELPDNKRAGLLRFLQRMESATA